MLGSSFNGLSLSTNEITMFSYQKEVVFHFVGFLHISVQNHDRDPNENEDNKCEESKGKVAQQRIVKQENNVNCRYGEP